MADRKWLFSKQALNNNHIVHSCPEEWKKRKSRRSGRTDGGQVMSYLYLIAYRYLYRYLYLIASLISPFLIPLCFPLPAVSFSLRLSDLPIVGFCY